MAGAGPRGPRAIFLVGFMATGKTTVGRLLAERLGWEFADLDAEIERRAGRPVADLFAAEGEDAFRDRESAALAALCRRRRVVVATGGGAVLRAENRARMRRAGRVLVLRAPPGEIARRLGDAAGRPLLAGAADRRAAVERLLAERSAAYDEAGEAVDTGGRDPSAVAGEIAARLGTAP